MKRWNKLIYLLLAVMTACSLTVSGIFAQASVEEAAAETETIAMESPLEAQLTMEDLQQLNDGAEKVFVHNDRVTFVDGRCTDKPVLTIEEAADVVVSMIGLLGGDTRTQFMPWRTVMDTNDNIYYIFQQMYAGTTVVGGAVKVITDAEGKMIGLSSSIETELPEISESEGITAEEAEQIVLKYAEETRQMTLELLEGMTDKIILPMVLSVDDDEHEAEEARFVWVVYTNNPNGSVDKSSDLPYLAHYVTMDGTYLYSLATIIPGDEAGETGFAASYIFEFMEPAEYTGYVDLSDGTEMELTVTLMRDTRTGMYFLGNIERGIVVADCYEFLYNHGRVVLEYSPDNREWDQVALLSFYNYCRAWDYYNEIGWFGGDGLGTPILILNNFCDQDHHRIDNAAFMGNYLGWSIFGASLANDFSQCLDVIAHEFTHCVTGSLMTYNSYMNDYGAINEGMSDIQGQICDLMMGNEEDTGWLIGDKSITPIRSMSDPYLYMQPAYSWDLYYRPKVQIPTAINDEGGVHSNSSLLNNIAYRLVKDGGMSLEDARAFWFAVDCTMVPGTDYAQLSELLPWVLKASGMEQYADALQQAIDAVRLGIDTIPESFDADRALITLTLPDNENFTDGNWAAQVYAVDIDALIVKVKELFDQLKAGDYSNLPKSLQEQIAADQAKEAERKAYKENTPFFQQILDWITNSFRSPEEKPAAPTEEEEAALSDAMEAEFRAWFREQFGNIFFSDLGAAGQDGRTIRMVSRPGWAVPILMHMTFDENSTEPDQVVFAVYLMDRWFALSGFSEEGIDSSIFESEEMESFLSELMEKVFNIHGREDVLNLISFEVKSGEVCEIPSNGLERIVLPEHSTIELPEDADAVEPGRKSRPKENPPAAD